LPHGVADLHGLDALGHLDRVDHPTDLRQGTRLDRQIRQELVVDLWGRLDAAVRCDECKKLLALPGLAPPTLGSLLRTEVRPRVRAAGTLPHRRAAGSAGALPHRRAIAERRAWAARPVAERRARTARPATEGRARGHRPISERRTRSGQRRRHPLKSCPLAATVRPTEALAAATRAAPSAFAATLAATGRPPTRAGWSAAVGAGAVRHIHAAPVIVVHAAAIGSLATAAVTVVV
jgi:hypothetical protein